MVEQQSQAKGFWREFWKELTTLSVDSPATNLINKAYTLAIMFFTMPIFVWIGSKAIIQLRLPVAFLVAAHIWFLILLVLNTNGMFKSIRQFGLRTSGFF